MFDINPTITMTVVVSLCAVISPIFTTIINNHYQLKLRKLEINHEQYKETFLFNRNIFTNYLKYTGRCIYYPDDNALKEYGEHCFTALAFAPTNLRTEMLVINTAISTGETETAQKVFEQLAPKLYTIIEKL